MTSRVLKTGQCARCGGNLAACVRGCRGKGNEKIMSEETKPWRADMPISYLWTQQYAGEPFVHLSEVKPTLSRANAELDALRAQLAERDERIRELEEELAARRASDQDVNTVACSIVAWGAPGFDRDAAKRIVATQWFKKASEP